MSRQPTKANASSAKATRATSHAAVPSSLGTLFQALKTARLEIPEVDPTTRSPSLARRDDLVHHLATVLHGAFLVTLVERAQLGTPVVANASTRDNVNPGSSTEAAPTHEETRQAVASTTVDARWLSAVVQYCNFTVVLDDLAKAAEAFPDYLSVRWSLKATGTSVSATLAAALDDQATALTPTRSPGKKRSRSGEKNTATTALGSGALVARLTVYRASVPSVEEATVALEAAMKAKGTAAAQRAWRTHLSQLTAYGVFLQQHPLPHRAASPAESEDKRARERAEQVVSTTQAEQLTAEEEALLDQLSPELRNSLSRRKLLDVLGEMKRERDRADSKEDAEIYQRQINERLMSTYEHILALSGPKRRTFGAHQLLEKLKAESLYTEQRNVQEQLAILIKLKTSGLTASTVTAKGSVKAVANIDKLTADELKSVLVTVDPGSGSVKGVLDSVVRDSLH